VLLMLDINLILWLLGVHDVIGARAGFQGDARCTLVWFYGR
jgi:hypothetical protein